MRRVFPARNRSDSENQIARNQERFEAEYGIIKSNSYVSKPQYIETRIYDEFKKDKERRHFGYMNENGFDHTTCYKTNHNTYIVITSPYKGSIWGLNQEGVLNVSNTWTEIEPLYNMNARTFMKEFPLMKNMLKMKHIKLIRELLSEVTHKDIINLIVKCIPAKK